MQKNKNKYEQNYSSYMEMFEKEILMTEGFNKTTTATPVSRINVSETLPNDFSYERFDYDNNIEIKKNLAAQLGIELLKSNLIEFSSFEEADSLQINVTAKINALKPSVLDYVNLKQDKFIVKGVTFTNDELLEAVNKTFPEKLI